MQEGGHKSWYSYLVRILKYFKLDYLNFILDEHELLFQMGKIKERLQSIFIEKWKEDKLKFQNEGKIELLASLLRDFGQSGYLSKMVNPKHRIALTKMRISAHKFPIETGRYLHIPRGDRECPLGCGEVGDEYHFMIKCSVYQEYY